MIYEAAVRLPAKVTGIQPATGAAKPAAAGPGAEELAAQAQAEKARQEKKDQETMEQVLAGLSQAAADLKVHQQDYLEGLQRLAMELAVTIASHILHEQIQAGDFPAEALVRKVVEQLETTRPVTVYLHPEDLKLLQRRLGEGESIFPKKADVHLAADPTLGRGSCRAQAGDISVLADIEEQLSDIRRQLLEALPEAARKIEPALRSFPEKRQIA